MPNTLDVLKSKSKLLRSKLRRHGLIMPSSRHLDVFAKILGEKNWESLSRSYNAAPRPHTDYRLTEHLLKLVLKEELGWDVSSTVAETLVMEISWAKDYTPLFNTLPKHGEREVLIPAIFSHSNIFCSHRKRQKNCLQKRIRMWDDAGNSSLDHILYTGETLNTYDKLVFYSILALHPRGTPIGREFFLSQDKVEEFQGKNISTVNYKESMRRMRDCRISIPEINFFGPLILGFREVVGRRCGNGSSIKKNAYIVSLNPQLIKLYRDTLYDRFMMQGDLFHHSPKYADCRRSVHYGEVSSKLNRLRRNDFAAYTDELRSPWPTQDADIAAISAIIAKNAMNGSVTFALLDTWRELPDGDVEFSLPAWMHEALTHFVDLYGEQAGPTIFMKATEKLLDPFFHHNDDQKK